MSSSVASGAVGFFTKGIGSKLVVYVVLLWVLAAAFTFLTTILPDMLPKDLLGSLPDYFGFYLEMMCVRQWMSALLTVSVLKWIIRRIPIIGG